MSRMHLTPGRADQQSKLGAEAQYVINKMVGLLWSDQYLADAFNSKKRGWQSQVSRALSIESRFLRKAIVNFGAENLASLVNKNPAGDAPVVSGTSEFFAQMQWSNQACQETAAACPSGNSCGSCWCTSGTCVVAPPQQLAAAV